MSVLHACYMCGSQAWFFLGIIITEGTPDCKHFNKAFALPEPISSLINSLCLITLLISGEQKLEGKKKKASHNEYEKHLIGMSPFEIN